MNRVCNICKISVIVPVYNAEKYLSRCVDSILVQSFDDFELLLINDGSTDSSGQICDEYALKDSRVQVFHKENGGASSARNLGLDNAQGEWIAFVDSDDYVLPTFLELYFHLCKSGAELCISGIIPDYSVSDEYKITKTSVDYKGDVKDALKFLTACQMVGSLCNKLLKKSIIDGNRLRLNESFKFCEDEDFLLRYMVYINAVASTSKRAYVYFVPSWSKYNNLDNLPTFISMYKSILIIYSGNANFVTDLYQIRLLNEWLAVLRVEMLRALGVLPNVLSIIGWRIFRMYPFKTVCKKIVGFLNKRCIGQK